MPAIATSKETIPPCQRSTKHKQITKCTIQKSLSTQEHSSMLASLLKICKKLSSQQLHVTRSGVENVVSISLLPKPLPVQRYERSFHLKWVFVPQKAISAPSIAGLPAHNTLTRSKPCASNSLKRRFVRGMLTID